MKLKTIAAAIAAGSLGFGGQSWALGPDVPADLDIFMAGATAQDINIRQLFTRLCARDTLDVYLDNATPASPGARHSAFFCQLDPAQLPGLDLASPRVLFNKRSHGGSAQGVGPVLERLEIDSMTIRNGNCERDPTLDAAMEARAWRCRVGQPGDLVRRVPVAGVSDVEPGMFRGINTPVGIPSVDPARASRYLDIVSGGGLVFGLPVTTALRDALQRAQIDMGVLGPECEGRDTEPCMPSLSRQQLASLFAGVIGRWEQIRVVAAAGASRPLTEYARPGDITNNLVHLCRRVDGSGTQAVLNAKVLNTPCAAAAMAPTETSNPIVGPIVVLNPGAGDLDRCLDDFHRGSNDGGRNPGGVRAWAIGVQTTERNAGLARQYRHIRIDGVAPTLPNTASGRYSVWAEVTYQWRKAAHAGPTGDTRRILETIARDAASPTLMARNNARFVHPFGPAGYLATTVAGHTPPADGRFDSANPVNPYTHAPGVPLDHCRVPVVDTNQPNSL